MELFYLTDSQLKELPNDSAKLARLRYKIQMVESLLSNLAAATADKTTDRSGPTLQCTGGYGPAAPAISSCGAVLHTGESGDAVQTTSGQEQHRQSLQRIPL